MNSDPNPKLGCVHSVHALRTVAHTACMLRAMSRAHCCVAARCSHCTCTWRPYSPCLVATPSPSRDSLLPLPSPRPSHDPLEPKPCRDSDFAHPCLDANRLIVTPIWPSLQPPCRDTMKASHVVTPRSVTRHQSYQARSQYRPSWPWSCTRMALMWWCALALLGRQPPLPCTPGTLLIVTQHRKWAVAHSSSPLLISFLFFSFYPL